MSDGETHDDAPVSVFALGRPVAKPPDDRVVTTDSASVAAEAEVIVAVGGEALAALAVAGVSTPVYPIRDADSLAAILEAPDRLPDGTDGARQRPVVNVETPDGSTGSLHEVSLTAAEPGTISAFTIDRKDMDGAMETTEERVARFRADGVVVATPAGSNGYAHAAGGPVVGAGSDVLAVVPVAPFATDPDHWVLPLSSLSITVERDVDISVTVDGRPFATLSPKKTVRFGRAGALPILSTPERG